MEPTNSAKFSNQRAVSNRGPSSCVFANRSMVEAVSSENTSNAKAKIIGAGLCVGILVGVVGAWALGWFSAEPEAVSIDAAIDSVTPTTEAPAAETEVEAEVTTTTVPTQSVETLDGTWSVEQSDATFVGYRIKENLSGKDIEAVGRTKTVTGTLIAVGGTITEVRIDASLVDLTSDSRIRDSQMKSQALETTQFPDASFVLTSPIPVGSIPVDGEALAFIASGQLTLHGVTRSIDVPIQAATTEGQLIVVGAVEVALAEFEIEKPEAPAVASVSDTATMEISLLFTR